MANMPTKHGYRGLYQPKHNPNPWFTAAVLLQKSRGKSALGQLTRHETVRWLITTAATAHQRCFSQASKKTTPQNMWRRIMAIVMKAGKGRELLHAAVCSRCLQFLNGRAATWGQKVVLGVPVNPHGARPHRVSQDVHHGECSAHESKPEARNCWQNKSFIFQGDLRNSSRNHHC